MSQNIFVGVDGGATKCVVTVEDEGGHLLGREVSGPANIRISVDQAWQSVNEGLSRILQPLSISLQDKHYHFHAGMGLAGCEIKAAYQSFLNHAHPFNTLIVSTDAHTACLGAHHGEDGAIIIAGTGVVGFETVHHHVKKVGGWGFPHDDEGGGAWIGLEAVKITLQWLDGRLTASELANLVFNHFDRNRDKLVSWANQANSTAYAELAPIVIRQSKVGDAAAVKILQRAAQALDRIAEALAYQNLPCVLIGGVAPFIEPYLSAGLRARLRPCQLTPDAGAVLLVRQYLKDSK